MPRQSVQTMSVRNRDDILAAYMHFSPSSVDIIARIEHMEQVGNMDVYCKQLCEDGMLEESVTTQGIVEYSLTDSGRKIIEANAQKVTVPSTKITIFRQLKIREQRNVSLRNQVQRAMASLDGRFVCILEMQSLLGEHVSIPELSSILCGLIWRGHILSCGVLYGDVGG